MEQPNSINKSDVQDIIGKPPSWPIKYGMSILLIIAISLIIGVSFVSYPGKISAPVTINCLIPSTILMAQTDGYVSNIYVKNKAKVEKNQIIAIIGDLFRIQDLKYLMRLNEQLESSPILGKAIYRIEVRDSVMSGSIKEDYQVLKKYILDYKFQVSQERRLKMQKDSIIIWDRLKGINKKMKRLDECYVFRAPINGIISFLDVYKDSQYIKKGNRCFKISPLKQEYEIKSYLSQSDFSKISVGQTAFLKLNNFPSEKYGEIQTIVVNKSNVENDSTYIVKLELKNGLVTTLGKKIFLYDKLRGTVDYFYDNKSILNKLIKSTMK